MLAMELTFLVLLTLASNAWCQNYTDSTNLKNQLFTNYRKDTIPRILQTDMMEINLTMTINSIKSIDVTSQTLSLNTYLYFEWVDELLTWNPTDHNNLTVIYVSSNEIWFPPVNIVDPVENTYQHVVDFSKSMPVKVKHTGECNVLPYAPLSTSCKMVMTKFPYDKHSCQLSLFSVTVTNVTMKLSSIESTPIMEFYNPHDEWELLSATLDESVFSFPTGDHFSYLGLNMKVQRLPGFFIVNLLCPSIALSLLNILVFVLPAESGEKMGYSITVLLSVMLFMTTASSYLPTSSTEIPLVTQYLTILTIISILSAIATVLILLYTHKKDRHEKEQEKKENTLSKWKTAMKNRTNARNCDVVIKTENDDVKKSAFLAWGSKDSKVRINPASEGDANGDFKVVSSFDGNFGNNLDNRVECTDTVDEKQCHGHDTCDSDGTELKHWWQLCDKLPASIDTICFIIFLPIWILVTLVYLIAIFSE